jgi:PAS domain S-box-containing protein
MSDAVPVAKNYASEADVIVSRGGTVLILREAGITTPIVEVQVTGKDLAAALGRARALVSKDRPRIGVISYPNMIQHLQDFMPFLNLDIACYELSTESKAQDVVDEALQDGVDVLLGGVITTRAAARRGAPTVLIESGEAALKYAFDEARRIAYARRLESRRTEELRAIMDYAYEGIVAVNGAGKLTLFNPVARAIAGGGREADLGKAASEVIPELGLEETLKSGGEETGKLLQLGRSTVMASKIPIRVGGDIVGAVATLHDVTSIQDMEQRIRKEIYQKGHVAKFTFADIVAQDPAMLRTLAYARQFARTSASVVIKGETGVGKELLAQGIHNAGDRADGAFVAVNCAALPENLLESELFGYVDGAFTGASKKGKPGLFELAHRGTIFLDEISEIPLNLQGRLLRVLQEHEVMRLGHDRVIPVDVRVISATNKDLRALVASGAFRNDLYWRLNVLSLAVPPLRERREDILPLIRHSLINSELCSAGEMDFTAEARRFLRDYAWPGNIRELRNLCDRIAVMCDEVPVDEDAVKSLLEYAEAAPPQPAAKREEIQPRGEDLVAFVRECGNLSEAADRLGIHRSTLWRRLKRLGYDK